MNRDFKGVWIPKEVWLNNELTILDKVILVEIDSLDNENHCTAGNEYFAEFCQCSESKITKSITKLKKMGLIEFVNFNGRTRTIKSLLKNESRKIYEADSQNLRPININNNLDNIVSKDTIQSGGETETTSFEFGISEDKKPKKKTNVSEQELAIDLVNNYTKNSTLKAKLIDLVKLKKDMASKSRYKFYASTIENYLKDLTNTFGNDNKSKIGAVELSIRYNGTTKIMIPHEVYNSAEYYKENFTSPKHEGVYTPAVDENGNPLVF